MRPPFSTQLVATTRPDTARVVHVTLAVSVIQSRLLITNAYSASLIITNEQRRRDHCSNDSTFFAHQGYHRQATDDSQDGFNLLRRLYCTVTQKHGEMT